MNIIKKRLIASNTEYNVEIKHTWVDGEGKTYYVEVKDNHGNVVEKDVAKDENVAETIREDILERISEGIYTPSK
jgi:hypothetical protein